MLFCVLPTYCTSGVGPAKRITTAILVASHCSTLPHSLQSLVIAGAYAQHTAAHRCRFISPFLDKHLAASANLQLPVCLHSFTGCFWCAQLLLSPGIHLHWFATTLHTSDDGNNFLLCSMPLLHVTSLPISLSSLTAIFHTNHLLRSTHRHTNITTFALRQQLMRTEVVNEKLMPA
jgi:hypothetical protein